MEFIAIDFETANSFRGSACEVGIAVVKDLVIVDSFSHLIKPKENVFDPFNTRLHGIDEDAVEGEPEFDDIWKELAPYLENKNVIAHNAGFDISVLRHVLDEYGLEYPSFLYSCTYQISKRNWKGLFSYRLDSICRHLGISLEDHHRAKSDAIACAKIAIKIFEENNINAFSEISDKFFIRIGKIFPGGYSGSRVKQSKKISDIEYDDTKADANHIFFNRNVVFTGTLNSLVRREAQQMVLEVGGKCSSGVNQETDFLVVGEQDYTKFGEGFKSSKMKKAEKLLSQGQSVELITEGQFLELIKGD